MPKVGENLPKEQRDKGLKRLTQRQQDFLDNFIHKDMTQTNAARQAGYSNPSVDAVRLLRNPVVQERWQEMQEENRSRFGVTLDKSLRDLLKIRNEALERERYSEAIRAEELRLKASGLLVNKAHVLHEKVDSMTKEDILAELENLQRKAQDRMKKANVNPVGSGSGVWIGLFYAANAYNCSLSGAGYRDRIGLQPPAAGCIRTIVRIQGPAAWLEAGEAAGSGSSQA